MKQLYCQIDDNTVWFPYSNMTGPLASKILGGRGVDVNIASLTYFSSIQYSVGFPFLQPDSFFFKMVSY